MLAAPDQQISFTDPDCRSMATGGRGSGMVGYNVQAAVDTTNHLIVAHAVTNINSLRTAPSFLIGGSISNGMVTCSRQILDLAPPRRPSITLFL